ncbi:MAG: PqqD family protein [Coprococcus sp.]
MPHTGFYARIACKYFKKPESSCISLDKYGTTVWKNINGKNTIYDIVRIMQQTFPNDNSNMLKRVITFMTILETNKFIVFS